MEFIGSKVFEKLFPAKKMVIFSCLGCLRNSDHVCKQSNQNKFWISKNLGPKHTWIVVPIS